MPELPEVETVRRGLAPLVEGRKFGRVTVHETRLRYPVDRGAIENGLKGQTIRSVSRRAKYLLFDCGDLTLMAHLGMTGRFQYARPHDDRAQHLHATFELDDGHELRFIDPRRFGMLECVPHAGLAGHRLLHHLGPEPLSDDFHADYLCAIARGRKKPIKNFIMDAGVVVGVGNIYASESLFLAGIHPHRATGRISEKRLAGLTHAVKQILGRAVEVGGTTLKDFLDPQQQAGYFRIELNVYDREGEPCKSCGTAIKRSVQSNRSTWYCPSCQR